jgi:hypothetical protein
MYGQPISGTIPVVGETIGPDYAEQVNDLLQEIIDCIEAPVTEASIEIGDDLPLGGFAVTGVGGVGFDNLAEAPSDAGYLFMFEGELWWTNGDEVTLQITIDGVLNTSGVGDFGGDFGGGNPAFVGFNDAGSKFYFNEASGLFAFLEAGGLKIRRQGESSPNTLTVAAPAALAGSITRTLLGANPGASSALLISSSGVESASTTLSGFALTPASVAASSYLQTVEAAVRHGERTTPISGVAGHGSATSAVTHAGLTETTDGLYAYYWIPVAVGDRIKSVVARILDTNGAGGAMTMRLDAVTIATGSRSQIGSTQTSAADGTEQPLTIDNLTTTAATGVAYVVEMRFPTTIGAGTPVIRGLTIVHDRVA